MNDNVKFWPLRPKETRKKETPTFPCPICRRELGRRYFQVTIIGQNEGISAAVCPECAKKLDRLVHGEIDAFVDEEG